METSQPHQPASRCRSQGLSWRMGGKLQKLKGKQQTIQQDLGLSQGSSLPHSLHESLFQSVHTHSPFFHQRHPTFPFTLKLLPKDLSEIEKYKSNQTPQIPLLCTLFQFIPVFRVRLTQTYFQLISCHSPALILPSLPTDRGAGLLYLPCSFLHLTQT